MTATSTVAAAFKGALYDAATALWANTFPQVLVVYGRPGVNIVDDMVLVLGVTSEQEPAAIGPQRQREEVLTCEVQFWIFRPGEEDAEREATDFLYARLGELENYVRATDTNLGGIVRECFLTSHQFDTSAADSATGSGRIAVANATFTAKVRIRTTP